MDLRLNDLETAVTKIKNRSDAVLAAFNGLAAELRRIAPNQVEIDKLAARIDAKAAAFAAAIAAPIEANTDVDNDPKTNPPVVTPDEPEPTDDDDT